MNVFPKETSGGTLEVRVCECVVFQLFIFKHLGFLPFVFRSYHAILLSIHLAVNIGTENKNAEI